ncbi:SpoIIE family protein phosphatase [Aquihabitans sp. G128]|uniref:PP2C family protein-serine/threonine phosphatase n=1 Tax=Aquihabitans sp. G128 TaxID=2849779 RepID=UPI001C21D408|nr:SpoIIE family protein phosphatase [Aquihabitans sp. G128]QXC59457.1 SpoIIE family protein phosphatase [Aquihabitans sp. G128]
MSQGKEGVPIAASSDVDSRSTWTALGRPYRILLVEDDRGDALLVEATLEESMATVEVAWHADVPSPVEVEEARADCVLVDLGLPGRAGLEALAAMLELVDGAPVIVLTGLDDRATGMEAVAAGAADYLVKGDHDGEALVRAIGFAVERTHAEAARARWREAEFLRAENLRLERGLLPKPVLEGSGLQWSRRYRPGAETSVLGGDFFDAVLRPDGSVRVVLGDVSGHGPDEAALGVCLRIAWRTLVLRSTPDDEVLGALDDVLDLERQHHQFCTVADLTIAADRSSVTSRLAGHPPPIVLGDDGPAFLDNGHRGVPLGIPGSHAWPDAVHPLPAGSGLLLYSDGAFESLRPDGTRIELAGLLDLVAAVPRPVDAAGLDALLDHVERPHREAGHPDDLALLGILVP